MNLTALLFGVLRGLVVVLGLCMAGGTLLSFSKRPHWFIRGWDFPRVLIGALALFAGTTYALFFFEGTWLEWAFLALVAFCVGWQAHKIYPYTPLARHSVKRARRPQQESTLRLVASNVQMDNEQYARWLEVIRGVDPDIILAVEPDDRWAEQLAGLEENYPHVVRQPQDNYYGMMLFSRLELIDPTVRFVVQDDVPSIQTTVRLPNDQLVYLHGVHPRPPEPLRDQDATARDAEIVLIGREIDEQEERRPTIIAGDFNDVAWSHTSQLFQRLSQLLDPRRGRGLYNTFDANNPIFRFPLDHVFHSNHFKLVTMERLDYVGSDHFPVLIELSYEPEAEIEQEKPDAAPEEEEEADEKVEQAARDPQNGMLDEEDAAAPRPQAGD